MNPRYSVLRSTITARVYPYPYGNDKARARSQRSLDEDDREFCLHLAGGKSSWLNWFKQLFHSKGT